MVHLRPCQTSPYWGIGRAPGRPRAFCHGSGTPAADSEPWHCTGGPPGFEEQAPGRVGRARWGHRPPSCGKSGGGHMARGLSRRRFGCDSGGSWTPPRLRARSAEPLTSPPPPCVRRAQPPLPSGGGGAAPRPGPPPGSGHLPGNRVLVAPSSFWPERSARPLPGLSPRNVLNSVCVHSSLNCIPLVIQELCR